MESKEILPTPPAEPAADTVEGKKETPTLAKDTLAKEFGGSGKPEPTRYGDWEVNGRCVDF